MKELTPRMRLSALISLLRDPSQWPEDFKWEYSNCETCAMGLAFRVLGIRSEMNTIHSEILASSLDISHLDAKYIFCCLKKDKATPEGVADALEALYAQG